MTTRFETPAQRVRTLAIRLIRDGRIVSRNTLREAGFRASDSVVGDLINELIEDGTVKPENLHRRRRGRARSTRMRPTEKLPVYLPRVSPKEEERVEIPPPRRYEGEARPAPKPETLWESLARTYWVPGRRALYRKGGLA